ncbi:hypothetical protein GCM10023085_43710 [Actinomadura viridis]|uniref:Uncharacterized protein n=1 Tax=Actinomadura viridis TaxID=58110 RepID=A0A931GJH5_9ACTN|nr:hypothetical protein [Actinomadura viridis]
MINVIALAFSMRVLSAEEAFSCPRAAPPAPHPDCSGGRKTGRGSNHRLIAGRAGERRRVEGGKERVPSSGSRRAVALAAGRDRM